MIKHVAKSEDIEIVTQATKPCERKFEGIQSNLAEHSEDIADIRRESYRSELRRGISATQEWSTCEGGRHVHVRRCKKHMRKERLKLQTKVDERLQQGWIHKFLWLSPCLMSHTLSFEILDAGPHNAKAIADKLNLNFAAAPIEVKGAHIRAAVETSPARRRHTNRDLAVQLNGDKITKRERAPDIYGKTGCIRIDHAHKTTSGWAWCAGAAATA